MSDESKPKLTATMRLGANGLYLECQGRALPVDINLAAKALGVDGGDIEVVRSPEVIELEKREEEAARRRALSKARDAVEGPAERNQDFWRRYHLKD